MVTKTIKQPKETKKFPQQTVRGVEPELWLLVKIDALKEKVDIGVIFNRILRAYYQGEKK